MSVWEDIGRPLIGIGAAALGWQVAGPIGGMIGWGLGMGIGGALFPAEAERTMAQSSGPAQQFVPQANLGAVLPMVMGRRRIAGNLIWYDNFVELAFQDEGHQQQWIGTYTDVYGGTTAPGAWYWGDWAIGVCIGPATVLRFWIGKNEYIIDPVLKKPYRINEGVNVPPEYMTKTAEEILAHLQSTGAKVITWGGPDWCRLEIYDGTQTDANTWIAESKGADIAPPYRNLCYVVFKQWPTSGMNVVQQVTFETASIVPSSSCLEYADNTSNFTSQQEITQAKSILSDAGNLYHLYWNGSNMQLVKIDESTMDVLITKTFLTSTMQQTDDPCVIAKDTSTISLLAFGSDGESWYIWEIDTATLNVNKKYATGWVCQGTDGYTYQFSSIVQSVFSRDNPDCKPITGGFWTSAWRLLDSDCDTLASAWGPSGSAPSCSGVHRAIAFDGTYYYITENDTYGKLAKLDTSSNDGFIVTALNAWQIELVDGYLYVCEWGPGVNSFYKIDPSDLSIVVTSPALLMNIAVMRTDGTYLYFLTNTYGTQSYAIEKYDSSCVPKTYYLFSSSSVGVTLTVGIDYLYIGLDDVIQKIRTTDLLWACSLDITGRSGGAGIQDGIYLYIDQFADTNVHSIYKYRANFNADFDVTPQSITNRILTDEFIGCGFDPTTYLETTETVAAEQYAIDNDLLMSIVFDQQRSVLDALQYVLQHHNGFITYLDGKIAHRQLQIDDADIAWQSNAVFSDSLNDNVTGTQWRSIT